MEKAISLQQTGWSKALKTILTWKDSNTDWIMLLDEGLTINWPVYREVLSPIYKHIIATYIVLTDGPK